jgi:hypothetical protein
MVQNVCVAAHRPGESFHIVPSVIVVMSMQECGRVHASPNSRQAWAAASSDFHTSAWLPT